MSKNPNNKDVAEAIRVEVNEETDDMFIVFKVVDNHFKQKIRDHWLDDSIELKVTGRKTLEEIDST